MSGDERNRILNKAYFQKKLKTVTTFNICGKCFNNSFEMK